MQVLVLIFALIMLSSIAILLMCVKCTEDVRRVTDINRS